VQNALERVVMHAVRSLDNCVRQAQGSTENEDHLSHGPSHVDTNVLTGRQRELLVTPPGHPLVAPIKQLRKTIVSY